MKDMTMKKIFALAIVLLGAGWQTAEALMPFPVNPRGPALLDAIEDSNPRLLKQMLIQRQQLPRTEKATLLRRAKEIAIEKRRGISIFRSYWDLGRFAIGGLLTINFLLGLNILGDSDKLEKVDKELKDMKTPDERFEIPKGKTYKDKFTTKPARKEYKMYATQYEELSDESGQLSFLGYIDTHLLGPIGFYLFLRGYFCVTAHQSFAKAQRIVDMLERVPVIEDR